MSNTPPSDDEGLREELISILVHCCELSATGDAEKELSRATNILMALISQKILEARIDELKNVGGVSFDDPLYIRNFIGGRIATLTTKQDTKEE